MGKVLVDITKSKLFSGIELNDKTKNILVDIDKKFNRNYKILEFVKPFFEFNDFSFLEEGIENYLKDKKVRRNHSLSAYCFLYGPIIGDYLFKKYSVNLKRAQRISFDSGRKINTDRLFKDYWIKKGLTEDEVDKYFEYLKERRRIGIRNSVKFKMKDRCPTQKGYWIKKGFTEEEAIKKLKDRQTTNSVTAIQKRNNCSLEEAEQIRKNITDKWQNTLNSKSEEEKRSINRRRIPKNRSNVTISKAENELAKLLNCKQQLVLKRDDFPGHYVYDLYKGNKIIEYNGDYWHCNPNKFLKDYFNEQVGCTAEKIWKKDSYKIERAKELGYDVLVVWECDFKKNKQHLIKECEAFLNE